MPLTASPLTDPLPDEHAMLNDNDGNPATPADAANPGPTSGDAALPCALQQQQRQQQPQPTLEDGVVIQGCDDVPDGVTFAGGVVTFVRDVDCTGELKVWGGCGDTARHTWCGFVV